VKIGSRLINARSETITEKPSFRAASARRRCLVPADGYFEWEKIDGRKVPQFLYRPDEQLLSFAGLYELWPDPERGEDDPDRWMWSYTIITRTAPDAVGHIHDRSPVLVPPDLRADWLNPSLVDPEQVKELLASIPEPLLSPGRYPVP
jgi:putative SOS response-associated peptidase YedK